MVVTTSWKPLLLVLLALSNTSTTYGEGCDSCEYDGEDDLTECKDYGLIDNSILVGWYLGSEACMDEFNLRFNSPDPTVICSSANSFVSELRFGSLLNTAKLGLGVSSQGGFFDDDSNLKDEIVIAGATLDCAASESTCYNAMKPYFDEDSEGKKEMAQVCDQLRNNVKKDRELAQKTLRNRLCHEFREEGTVIPDLCDPLWEQLQAKMDEYPDKICPGFAFGVQNSPIPGCDGQKGSSATQQDSSGRVARAADVSYLMLLLWASTVTLLLYQY